MRCHHLQSKSIEEYPHHCRRGVEHDGVEPRELADDQVLQLGDAVKDLEDERPLLVRRRLELCQHLPDGAFAYDIWCSYKSTG